MFALAFSLLGLSFADSPQISTSQGPKNGIVVMWPRVIPATEDPAILAIAQQLQDRTAAIASSAFPDLKQNVRPAPQRVCPQAGCKAVSFGSVLMHNGTGCAVGAWMASPGRSPARPVPWSPGVTAKVPTLPFREPVEGAFTITDFQRCDRVLEGLTLGDAQVTAELKAFVRP